MLLLLMKTEFLRKYWIEIHGKYKAHIKNEILKGEMYYAGFSRNNVQCP